MPQAKINSEAIDTTVDWDDLDCRCCRRQDTKSTPGCVKQYDGEDKYGEAASAGCLVALFPIEVDIQGSAEGVK